MKKCSFYPVTCLTTGNLPRSMCFTCAQNFRECKLMKKICIKYMHNPSHKNGTATCTCIAIVTCT